MPLSAGDPAPRIELVDDTGAPWSTDAFPGRPILMVLHRHFY